MATATAAETSKATSAAAQAVPQSGRRDRIFYSGMAIAMALTVFIGFAPTFYLRGLAGSATTVTGATSLPLLVILHGTLFTSWVLLFIIQTALVATRRVAVHRRMGIAGAVLAAAMIVAGISVAIKAAQRGAAPPGVDALAFLAVPMGDMAIFAILITAALGLRRKPEAHKRMMLLAYIALLAAAFARFPGVLPLGPLAFFGLAFIFLLVAVAYDLVTRGRVHPAYLWGGAALVASVPLRLMISGTHAWHRVAETLVGR